jgi:predicted nucleic acid-binding protein
VTDLIVADAGPLIGLARVGLLSLLRDLYGRVLIPAQVLSELRVSSEMPGARALSDALSLGWLLQVPVRPTEEWAYLKSILDAGEAEAIALAQQQTAALLIDERHGRAVAQDLGLLVIGTGSVLLKAKKARLLDRVETAIEQLAASGYRLSPGLRKQLLELAGEA